MSTPSISVTPSPATAGGTIEVCYDFTGSTVDTVQLQVEFDLLGGGTEQKTISLSKTDNCETVDVPSNATSGTVDDLSGQANPDGFAVKDPAGS
ncbi:MAG: hypothetical protein AAF196_02865 [Planctomycetota bacterium]